MASALPVDGAPSRQEDEAPKADAGQDAAQGPDQGDGQRRPANPRTEQRGRDRGTPEAARSSRRLSGEQRREQLLEVALREFGERGFRSTTMDEIAESAGVTKPLVYQHFRSKRALYFELVDAVTRDLLRSIHEATADAEGPRQLVEMGFAAYFHEVVAREAVFQLLFDREGAEDPNVAAALRKVEDALAEAIDPLIAAGLDAEHRRLLAYSVVGMAEGAYRHWANRRAQLRESLGDGQAAEETERQAQRLASRVADLAWAGLRSVHAD